jgi:hypothetical protein
MGRCNPYIFTNNLFVNIKIHKDMIMETSDKRICERKMFNRAFSFEINYTPADSEPFEQKSYGIDISSCGVGIQTDHAVQNGSVLKFNLPMREVEVTIPVFAQVMWSMPANDHFRVGLRFLA